MQNTSCRRHRVRAAFMPLLWLSATAPAFGLDTYNAANRQLTIPALAIGDTAYANVVVTVGQIVSGPRGSSPAGSVDSYDPETNQLVVQAVRLGSSTYYNVVVTVADLVAIGGVSGADAFNGADLTVAAVQVDGAVYGNVVVGEALGDVVTVAGGMPTAAPDTFDASTNRLAIPAVQVGSTVYTNVVVKVGPLQSVGGVVFRNQESLPHAFLGVSADGINPTTNLIQGSDGNFYGTTPQGGAFNEGAVYRITPAGVETLLYSFGSQPADGLAPAAAMVQGNDGNFYGTTGAGGANGDGTVFRITPAGAETILHSFGGGTTDGLAPAAALIVGSDGNFYGTTPAGGAFQFGTVFKVTPSGTESVVYSFGGVAGDGRGSPGALIQDSAGNFYGTTVSGGSHGEGTVFKITPSGTETVLYSFGASLADANTPFGGLIPGTDGNFCGTSFAGGSFSGGALYCITPAGSETVLYSFGNGSTDGAQPQGAPILANDGNFYGISQGGGDFGDGAVYKVTPAGSGTVIYSFGSPSVVTVNPSRVLIQGNDGNLYATTQVGGTYNYGAAVRITTAGAETSLYAFGNGTGDGASPSDALIQAGDGSFYGTTESGGAYNGGTVFRTSASGVESVLYSFGNGATDAASPVSLFQGSDGNLYGNAPDGGAYGGGAVFRITPGGVESVLYSFGAGATDGDTPYGSLIEGSDGNFYGTTIEGGANGGGTLFRLSPTGAQTVLYAFGDAPTDGVNPEGGVIQGADGNFYGTTVAGGTNGDGTVFRVTPAGVETILYSFGSNRSDGSSPAGSVIQDSAGNLYGTTPAGGAFSGGTVFRVSSSGVGTVLYAFGNGAGDGNSPGATLVRARDGNFYGTTSLGGSNNDGTVFKVTPTGVETVLYSFGSGAADGTSPAGALVEGSDGNLYGTTATGGANFNGAFFRVTNFPPNP